LSRYSIMLSSSTVDIISRRGGGGGGGTKGREAALTQAGCCDEVKTDSSSGGDHHQQLLLSTALDKAIERSSSIQSSSMCISMQSSLSSLKKRSHTTRHQLGYSGAVACTDTDASSTTTTAAAAAEAVSVTKDGASGESMQELSRAWFEAKLLLRRIPQSDAEWDVQVKACVVVVCSCLSCSWTMHDLDHVLSRLPSVFMHTHTPCLAVDHRGSYSVLQ
jgi:hypothetical protein